jgi:ABC-type dipeptide/oligopeptide/nickel transport system ATPase component
MKLTVPELSLVVLIGPSGSGKSSFARQHFKPTEVLSSDYCRGLVSDDENNQAATTDAFEVLHFIGAKRLAAAHLTVVDATRSSPRRASSSSRWRGNIIACRLRLFSICPRNFARNAIKAGPIATSARMSFVSRRSKCGAPCGS